MRRNFLLERRRRKFVTPIRLPMFVQIKWQHGTALWYILVRAHRWQRLCSWPFITSGSEASIDRVMKEIKVLICGLIYYLVYSTCRCMWLAHQMHLDALRGTSVEREWLQNFSGAQCSAVKSRKANGGDAEPVGGIERSAGIIVTARGPRVTQPIL